MEAKNKPSLEEILPEAQAFNKAFDSLLLATVNPEGKPDASYAAYIADDKGRYYIFISELATHTENLRNKRRASVLFIEDESNAQHLFARKRLTVDCRAELVFRGTRGCEEVMNQFVEKHGKFMTMLKGLEDFHLYRLMPENAIYIRGFAEAFELTGEQLGEIRHINDKGHRSKDAETAKELGDVVQA